jgi:multicomponent Na+:H+ antiporter subunit E
MMRRLFPFAAGALWSWPWGFTLASFVSGFVAAWGLQSFWLWFPQEVSAAERIRRTARFLWDFFGDLMRSNLRVMRDIWSPVRLHSVRLVEVPVGDLSPGEITFLAQRITLTPGTLSCDVSSDRQHLLVHCMFPSGDMAAGLRKPMDILKGRA